MEAECSAKQSSAKHIPYSGLFSWVEIFVKCWLRSSELIFVVLIFVAPAFASSSSSSISADDVI